MFDLAYTIAVYGVGAYITMAAVISVFGLLTAAVLKVMEVDQKAAKRAKFRASEASEASQQPKQPAMRMPFRIAAYIAIAAMAYIAIMMAIA